MANLDSAPLTMSRCDDGEAGFGLVEYAEQASQHFGVTIG